MSSQKSDPVGNRDLADAVIVALGANDKGQFVSCKQGLEEALVQLQQAGLKIVARSSWWQSAAWPNPSDPPFLNGVAIVETELDPKALMQLLSGIEDALGRVRSVRNAPRTLDLDLIAYGRISADLDGLYIPHPRASERLFVMGPLAEIAPEWRHPDSGEMAKNLAMRASVGVDAAPVGQGAS
ncbi:2-amino-4-hydroxy-6-hydroxymethyldihydropteridine diphosphokinase [Brevundimonas sp.]|uniref:2-amino-4-hydroxy-6- hydroxymethyldihydropteridine diphosphokinase n=1 Tax=Brevundimonas sp. TaxID=1871086 RepID=UPI002FC59939